MFPLLTPRLALAAAVLAFLVGSHWWAYGEGKDVVHAEMGRERAAYQTEVIEQARKVRAIEGQLEDQKRKAEDDAQKARALHARTVVALRADADQLRGAVAAFAAGGGAEDSLASCRGRADALGVLVSDGLRVQDQLAAGAEACGTDLRAVLAAWPVNAK